MNSRPWLHVAILATTVSVLSLVSGMTAPGPAGSAPWFLLVQGTLSELLNSGTVWAGLGLVAGFLVAGPGRGRGVGEERGRADGAAASTRTRRVWRWVWPAVAASCASLWALAAHYALGIALGVMTPEIWGLNASWFVLALVAGGPLGIVGAAGRLPGRWGLAARLVLPLGAIAEPLVTGMLGPARTPMWTASATSLAGLILLLSGIALGAFVLVRARRGARVL